MAKTKYDTTRKMKVPFFLMATVFALLLGGCAEQPLMSDEEYNARHGPAPFSPDFSGVLPQNPTNPGIRLSRAAQPRF